MATADDPVVVDDSLAIAFAQERRSTTVRARGDIDARDISNATSACALENCAEDGRTRWFPFADWKTVVWATCLGCRCGFRWMVAVARVIMLFRSRNWWMCNRSGVVINFYVEVIIYFRYYISSNTGRKVSYFIVCHSNRSIFNKNQCVTITMFFFFLNSYIILSNKNRVLFLAIKIGEK